MKRLAHIAATVALLCGAATALAPPAHAAPAQGGIGDIIGQSASGAGEGVSWVTSMLGGGPGQRVGQGVARTAAGIGSGVAHTFR
ncbi:hypothetical protein [Streptomyces sp. URMC 123]|uniref:hypothetical protein n=1 Tax=Streptomyces sp. URMC 123 TaxID=3423403 RepID=UPI003F1D8DC1